MGGGLGGGAGCLFVCVLWGAEVVAGPSVCGSGFSAGRKACTLSPSCSAGPPSCTESRARLRSPHNLPLAKGLPQHSTPHFSPKTPTSPTAKRPPHPPGTNVIVERQQRLTEEFVPRADMVLFVLSADRRVRLGLGLFGAGVLVLGLWLLVLCALACVFVFEAERLMCAPHSAVQVLS